MLAAIPVAGAVAGAVTAIGSAAVTAGVALFNITKQAAEFGSTVYDATQKTGLGAEAISSLKAAAEQSGSSLEAVTKGIAKFAKNYTGTSQDLQSELGKVMKRINEAKPGFEQLKIAQEAFGKSGGDLIPVIRSFDGDLPGLIAHMKELGLTIDDDGAAKADAFGDQLDILEGQLAGVGRTIGTELMPEFTRMAKDIGDFIVENKGEIRVWGTAVADTLSGVTLAWHDAARAVRSFFAESRAAQQSPFGGTSLGDILAITASPLGATGLNYFNQRGATERVSQEAMDANVVRVSDTSPGSFSRTGYGSRRDRTGHGGGGAGRSISEHFQLSSQGKALVDAANKLGIRPLDLAMIIGFETGGSYSTNAKNSGGYKGLIQFSPDIQGKYTKPGESFEHQVTNGVVRFLKDRFGSVGRSTAGASLLDLYRTVLGGNPNAPLTGTDANGTSPLSGVQSMLREHKGTALKRFFGGKESNAAGEAWGAQYEQFEAAREKDTADEKKKLADQLEYEMQWIQDWIAAERQAMDDRLDIRRSEADLAEEILKQQLNTGLIDETEYHERVAQLKIDTLQNERNELADQAESRENIVRLQILDLAIEKARLEKENAITGALREQNKERLDSIRDLKKKNQRPSGMATRQPTDYGFDAISQLGGFFDGQVKDKDGNLFAGNHAAAIGGLNALSTAFSELGQAVGSAVSAFVLYGSAGTSVRQVTAQILAAIAQQAAVQAIYELAQGLAVLALAYFGVPNAGPSATAHFAAAAMYGSIAGVTAIAGRAVAGDSFKKQATGGTGAPTGTNSGSGSSSQRNTTPYSRTSENAFLSGRTSEIRNLTATIDRLDSKLASMRPGDVLTRGAKEKRGFIAQETVAGIKANAGTGRALAKGIGLK